MCEVVVANVAFWIWGLTAIALLIWVIYLVPRDGAPAWWERLDFWFNKGDPLRRSIADQPLEGGIFVAVMICFFTLFACIVIFPFC
jgi:hypothetical protein